MNIRTNLRAGISTNQQKSVSETESLLNVHPRLSAFALFVRPISFMCRPVVSSNGGRAGGESHGEKK